MTTRRRRVRGARELLTAEPIAHLSEAEILGVFYRARRHLLSGEPESLKGWLCGIAARDRLRRGESVFWIDFEQGPAMTLERMRALGALDDELDRFLYIEPRESLVDAAREAVSRLVQAHRPSLVVFDAYAGLLSLDDADPNSEQAIERVNRRVLDLFRAHGAATVIVDHPVKAAAERGRYSSGSGRKLGECDVHIRLDRGQPFGRGRVGTSRIRNLKDRLGGLPHPSIGDLVLTSDPDSGLVTWEIQPPLGHGHGERATLRPTSLMEKVSRYLEKQGDAVPRRVVESDVTGRSEFVRLALDTLTAEGYIAETAGPRRARLVRIVKPYREAREEVRPTPSVLAPSSSRDKHDDFVPRPLPQGRDEDQVDHTIRSAAHNGRPRVSFLQSPLSRERLELAP